MNIEAAIGILLKDASRHIFDKPFAALALSAHLNWPTQPSAATNLVFLGITQAMLQKPEQSGQWLPMAMEAESYWKQLSAANGGGMFLPLFEPVLGEWGYEETRYVADIVRFLLTYKPRSKDKRMRASLGRASEYINKQGGFPDRKDGIGKRSQGWSVAHHQNVWATYKRTAAYQFVRYYDSDIDWLFDPRDPQLLVRAIEAVKDRASVLAFFSRVRWVQSELVKVLDPRSLLGSEKLSLPESLDLVPCRLPRVPKDFYEATGRYQRNRAEATQADEPQTAR